MRHQTQEEKNPQIETHSGRQQTNILRLILHSYSRFNHGQTPLEQRPIYTIWKIPHCRFQEFQPEKSNEEGRILQDSAQTHPPRYHRQI